MNTPNAKPIANFRKQIIAISILSYIATFLLYSINYGEDPRDIFGVPLIFSIIGAITFSSIRAVLPSSWVLPTFLIASLLVGGWYWNTPKTFQECVLKEIKSAQNKSATDAVIGMCRQKFR